MRSTRYTCRRCRTRLGVIRNGRVLSLEPGVRVAAGDASRADEVKVICPACRAGRTFRSGVVVANATSRIGQERSSLSAATSSKGGVVTLSPRETYRL
jgi:hypothetical protein